LRAVLTVMKLLIPLALAATVLVSAMTVGSRHKHTKPSPQRSLQLHR
jgi:hypothetical protein